MRCWLGEFLYWISEGGCGWRGGGKGEGGREGPGRREGEGEGVKEGEGREGEGREGGVKEGRECHPLHQSCNMYNRACSFPLQLPAFL